VLRRFKREESVSALKSHVQSNVGDLARARRMLSCCRPPYFYPARSSRQLPKQDLLRLCRATTAKKRLFVAATQKAASIPV